MDLDRRSFLKILGISAAVLAVDPMSAISNVLGYPHFNPRHQYGEAYTITDFVDRSNVKHYIKALDEKVVEVIPPPYRKKVQWIIKNPKLTKADPLAQHGEIGWIYNSLELKKKVTFV